MLRLDEVGDNYEVIKARIMTYATHRVEQSRGGRRSSYGRGRGMGRWEVWTIGGIWSGG